MNWLEITVLTAPEKLDTMMSKLEDLGVSGLVINDEASIREFLSSNPKAWDYVDDDIFDSVRGASSLQFYLEDSAAGEAELSAYRAALPDEVLTVKRVQDEDWQNNWKNYFKPVEIGQRLLIVPEWEPIPQDTDRIILRIEPKLVFGTGAHASTRMCLEELEHHTAKNVLDLGCGSGILAVAALLSGTESAVCCDIAQDAAAVCYENALSNSIDSSRLKAYTGDILSQSTLRDMTGGSRFELVFANIIADVIIPLSSFVKDFLTPGGVFICSGIIDGRQDEVLTALKENGFEILRAQQMDNWHMLAARAIV